MFPELSWSKLRKQLSQSVTYLTEMRIWMKPIRERWKNVETHCQSSLNSSNLMVPDPSRSNMLIWKSKLLKKSHTCETCFTHKQPNCFWIEWLPCTVTESRLQFSRVDVTGSIFVHLSKDLSRGKKIKPHSMAFKHLLTFLKVLSSSIWWGAAMIEIQFFNGSIADDDLPWQTNCGTLRDSWHNKLCPKQKSETRI